MRYTEFKQTIERTLRGARGGLTWKQLRDRAALPYDRPCPTWTAKLEEEIGLTREKGNSRALVWRVPGR